MVKTEAYKESTRSREKNERLSKRITTRIPPEKHDKIKNIVKNSEKYQNESQLVRDGIDKIIQMES